MISDNIYNLHSSMVRLEIEYIAEILGISLDLHSSMVRLEIEIGWHFRWYTVYIYIPVWLD